MADDTQTILGLDLERRQRREGNAKRRRGGFEIILAESEKKIKKNPLILFAASESFCDDDCDVEDKENSLMLPSSLSPSRNNQSVSPTTVVLGCPPTCTLRPRTNSYNKFALFNPFTGVPLYNVSFEDNNNGEGEDNLPYMPPL